MLDVAREMGREVAMKGIGGLLACAGIATGAVMFLSVNVTPARADCFENIGCTDSDYYDVDDLVEMSCENLWYVRNRIFDENGYCFKTARARRQFNNSNCYVDDEADIDLSPIEQHNVDEIVEAEAENGC